MLDARTVRAVATQSVVHSACSRSEKLLSPRTYHIPTHIDMPAVINVNRCNEYGCFDSALCIWDLQIYGRRVDQAFFAREHPGSVVPPKALHQCEMIKKLDHTLATA